MEYNFLVSPDDPPKSFGSPPPQDFTLNKFTPKMFLRDIGEAYKLLGGLTWLVEQAQVAPQEFMKLLQKIVPKQVDLDLMEGTTIKLIDQFGQTIELSHPEKDKRSAFKPATGGSSPSLPPGSGQPTGDENATSGSPTTPPPNIIEVFESD